MTPAQQKAKALEAMRGAYASGWTDQRARDTGAEALKMAGVAPDEADRIALEIWRDRFETAGPC